MPKVENSAESVPPQIARYCETCAARLEQARTRALALVVATCILAVFIATGLIFTFGARQVSLQIGLAGFCALLPSVALSSMGYWPKIPHSVLQSAAKPSVFFARNPEYAREAGLVFERMPMRVPRHATGFWLPVLLAIGWSVSIQFLGRAEVWVVHSQQDLTLLIDHSVIGRVPASLDETPTAGRREVVLGGRHTLTLLGPDGSVILEGRAALSPGRSYLFAAAPPGLCFFLVRQNYGREAARAPNPEVSRLVGPGPLWELPERIDVWFAPLPPAGPGLTSGGSRTALRMLGCDETRETTD